MPKKQEPLNEYYGIMMPEGHIYWIAPSIPGAWRKFFELPNSAPHRAPLSDAIKAYKAIGYKCVKIRVEVIGDA